MGGRGQISLDPVEVGQTRGTSGRTNRSRSETRPRPIQFARGWAGHGGARQGAPPDNTENRGSRGVVTADETKGGEQNGETALDRELLQPRIARELDN